jgi:osmotically-inducible protein OsmY
MKLKNLLMVLAVSASTVLVSTGCKKKPNDAEIKAKVETAVANPAVSVDVKECDVTLSGSVSDDASKNSAETAAKSVEGVKNVTNAIAVAEPAPVQAPVEIADDASISAQLAGVVDNYKGVKATVSNGVVTLTGNIKRDELQHLMQEVMALKPKSVENKLNIK